MTGRDLPRPVRDRLRQSAPNANVRAQDWRHHKKQPGFMSILDDSYLNPTDAPLDPIMAKSKYRDTFDKVTSPSKDVTSSHKALFSSTPRKQEMVEDTTLDVSSVPFESSSLRSDETLLAESMALSSSRDETSPPIRRGLAQPSLDRNVPVTHVSRSPTQSHYSTRPANQKSQPETTSQTAGRAADRFSGAKSKAPSDVTAQGPPKRNRKSAIMARAAFWDNRVTQGLSSDKQLDTEFPEMPLESFKR